MPRRSRPPSRRAELHAFHPDTRVEKILKTRQIPWTGDVPTLLAEAGRLLPAWRPWRMWTDFFEQVQLTLEYGTDDHGVQWSITIRLRTSDVPTLLTYALRSGAPVAGMLGIELPAEDGKGPTVPAPRLSPRALAALPTSVFVQ